MFITLDWETYFDNDYTLSKMTNEEYLRDPRFKAHGVGLRIGSAPSVYVPEGKIDQALARIPWKQALVLSHHAHFDNGDPCVALRHPP